MHQINDHINVFNVKDQIDRHGIWYAIWFYGTSRHALWTIFVASRMLKRECDALREHADWHYNQQR